MGLSVTNSDDHVSEWDKQNIINSLIKESTLASQFYASEPLDLTTASMVADEVETLIHNLNMNRVTGALIREVTNVVLLKHGFLNLPRFTRRIGLPVSDAYHIDIGGGRGDNANLNRQPETFHKRKADALAKEQALAMLPIDLAKLHYNADLHFHDLEYATCRQFCWDTDSRYFFYYGLLVDGTGNHTSVAAPAKNADVAILHIVKALASAQCNCSGGQGVFNFLVFLSPYLLGLDYKQIKQCMQLMVFELTQMYIARGSQPIFSSVQLTPGVPDLWLNAPVVYKGMVYDGREGRPRIEYLFYEKEVRLAFQAMMEVMLEGDSWGKPFHFPKPEIAIQKEFMKERDWFTADMRGCKTYEDLYLMAFELASKFGTPYFDNMLPKYRQTGGVECFQCCAYNFKSNEDTDSTFDDKMEFKEGAHFSMGSEQVLTINFPRLAYKSGKDEKKFISLCKELLDECVNIFIIKRGWVDNVRNTDGTPFLSQTPPDPITGERGSQFVDYDALVYTVGVIGLNEVVQHMTGKQLHESDDAVKYAMKICLQLKKYCAELSKKNGITIAFARTPAETTGQRFAVADLREDAFREDAVKVIKGNVDYALKNLDKKDLPVYYTNGTMVAPSADISLAEKIRIEEKFFPILDGGDICHLWLTEEKPDPKGLMDMTMKICKSTNLGYFSYTKDLTVCRGTFKRYTP